jgi:hypothetical protein
MSNNIEGTVVVITGACTGLAKRSPVSFGRGRRTSRWVRGAPIDPVIGPRPDRPRRRSQKKGGIAIASGSG